jgi:hypothetical protein
MTAFTHTTTTANADSVCVHSPSVEKDNVVLDDSDEDEEEDDDEEDEESVAAETGAPNVTPRDSARSIHACMQTQSHTTTQTHGQSTNNSKRKRKGKMARRGGHAKTEQAHEEGT